jgi:hypothetical protein
MSVSQIINKPDAVDNKSINLYANTLTAGDLKVDDISIEDSVPLIKLKDVDNTAATSVGAVQWFDSTTTLTDQVSKVGVKLQLAAIQTGGEVELVSDGKAIKLNSTNLNFEDDKINIGKSGSKTGQSEQTIAIGDRAGETGQNSLCIAIGQQSGQNDQEGGAVAVGVQSGRETQGAFSTAIGYRAGEDKLGLNAVAIGRGASALGGGFAKTIVINASGGDLNPTADSRCYIAPLRQVAHGIGVGIVFYDVATKELSVSTS